MKLPLQYATVMTLFRVEMRMVFRDRRMWITSILLPLLFMPLVFWVSSSSLQRQERRLRDTVYHYAVTGPEASAVRDWVDATRERLRASGQGKSPETDFKFEEVKPADALAALNRGDLHFILEGLTAEAARTNRIAAPNQDSKSGAPAPAESSRRPRRGTSTRALGVGGDEAPFPGALAVEAIFRGDRDDSLAGSSRMQDELSATRRLERGKLLRARGFPVELKAVAQASSRDLATRKQIAGLTLGRMLTLLLALMVLSGGSVVAVDLLAGEKERGTLETLLTTSARRSEILAAKHLVIVAVALIITFLQAANLLVYISLKLMPVPPNLAAAVPPPVALFLFVLYLPVAALLANVLLLVSGWARTYKEAQLYFLPVFLGCLVPTLAAVFPGIPLRSAILLVPIANIAVAVKEILTGSFDWPMILIAWLVTAGASVWVLRRAVQTLSSEKLVTAAEVDAVEYGGGPALFERHVLRWFAFVWALLILMSNYFSHADVRWQLVLNLVVVFFGASCFLIWRYRLNWREALALRAPRPGVWLAVLCGVPGGLLTAIGLFQLFNLVVPISPEMMEQFNQSVLPTNVPRAQLLIFLTVFPAIFEEITFRGVLLHGLRRRFHPALVAVVVGLIFGAFHMALFRFAPTAFLGILLAAVTMLSGSLYPAMLWHCLSNATGILAEGFGVPEMELTLPCYLVGAGLLAVSFWLLWRNRTPYPGLRSWRKRVPGPAT